MLGTDVFVRCLKLLKPYGQKDVEEEEDDENNDEDGDAPVKRNVLAEPRIIERDVLTQAYDIGQNATYDSNLPTSITSTITVIISVITITVMIITITIMIIVTIRIIMTITIIMC